MHHVIHLLNDSQRISAPTARDEPSQRSLMDTLDGPGVSHVMLQLFFYVLFKILSKCADQMIISTDQEDVFGVLNKRTALNFTHL